jgi:hypothetical protein
MKRFVWMGWMVTRLLFGRRERFVEAAILDLPEKDRQFTNAHATLTQQFDNAVSHVRRHFRLSLIASVAILVVGWMFAYLIAGCFKWPSVPTSLQIASAFIFMIAATGFVQEEIATWSRVTLPERASGWLLNGMFALGTLLVLISLNL